MPISGISSRGKRASRKQSRMSGEDAFVDEPARGLADQEFLFGELRIDEKVVDASECHESSVVPGLTGC